MIVKKYLISVAYFFTLFYILIVSLSFFIDNFVFEIIQSFLPYLFISAIVAIVLFLIIFIYQVRNKFKILLTGSFLIVLALLLILQGNKLYSYYFNKTQGSYIFKNTQVIKIASYNMQLGNQHFEEISNEIETTKPDILGLIGTGPGVTENINGLNKYSYHENTYNFDNGGIEIYSKFPIISKASVNKYYNLSVTINIAGLNYDLVVIHPPAPNNNDNFLEKNKDLHFIYDQVTSNTMLIGDFNTSSWSKQYEKFLNSNFKLHDTARGNGIIFTWGNKFISSNLDHIFVPKSFGVDKFQVLGKSGSDHNFILAILTINT